MSYPGHPFLGRQGFLIPLLRHNQHILWGRDNVKVNNGKCALMLNVKLVNKLWKRISIMRHINRMEGKSECFAGVVKL